VNGGLGAIMTGFAFLVQGTVFRILVGQRGGLYSSRAGGGGGTFIALQGASEAANALVVAGGGGGYPGSLPVSEDRHGQITPQGAHVGFGENGNGGTNNQSGGGFLSAGADETFSGKSYLSGGLGGGLSIYYGGFGCGGGCSNNASGIATGGGGGGYSGGGGGTNVTGQYHGGGGGSIVNAWHTSAFALLGEATPGANSGVGWLELSQETPGSLPGATYLRQRVVELQKLADPHVVVFDWNNPRRHIIPEIIDKWWQTAFPVGQTFGIYYLSSDNRCPPIIHGPYTAE
jgi:hypothetical protein